MKQAFLGRKLGGHLTLLVILWIVGTAKVVFGDEDAGEIGDNSVGGTSGDLSHGLGDHIAWHTLEEGRELAEKQGKPLMLIIHKSWCGACKSLKPKFKESQEIGTLSKEFIMVNTEDDEEPKGDEYKPDGGYIPRILFLDSSGKLMDITNESGNPQYKYYYFDADSVAVSMRKAASNVDGAEGKSEDAENNKLEGGATTTSDEEELQKETAENEKIEL